MITADHPLLQLLSLIDMVWIDTEASQIKRGGPKFYSEKTLFKVYVVSLLKQLWAHRSLWRYLSSVPLVASACGLVRIPDRRTLDRRLAEIAPQAEVQIQALGLTLSLEAVTDATVVASEPFFATIKTFFHLDPLPLQGKTNSSAFILLALYAWNLIVLFNFLNDRPLGVVKPVLDLL